jgi:hypothetical protein
MTEHRPSAANRSRGCLGLLRRFVLSFAAFLALTAAAFAQSPDSLANTILRYSHRGLGISPPTIERVLVLHANGTYDRLFSTELNPVSSPLVPILRIPASGTYSYVKTAATTGSLTAQEFFGVDGEMILDFQSATNGFIVAPLGGSFSMSSLPLSGALINTSERTWVSSDKPAIIGFVVGAGRVALVLIRAVGPGLASFPNTTPALDPRLAVYRGQTLLAENDDWGVGTVERPSDALRATSIAVGNFTGAFPLADGSKDAAIVLLLGAGNYTVHVRTAAGEPRAEVLGEIYVVE